MSHWWREVIAVRREALPESCRDILARYGLEGLDSGRLTLLRYQEGEVIHRQGEPMDYLLLVLSGRAKVCVATADGKSLLLSFYSGQGLLGEVELLRGDLRATTTGQAITDFVCVGVPLAVFGQELRGNVRFLNAAGGAMAQKLDRCCQNSALNLLHPLEPRLCAYLLMTHENGRLCDKLTELAELLGVSYRHLLRTLERLCKEGVLEKRGHSYHIKNEAALQRLADDFYLLE